MSFCEKDTRKSWTKEKSKVIEKVQRKNQKL